MNSKTKCVIRCAAIIYCFFLFFREIGADIDWPRRLRAVFCLYLIMEALIAFLDAGFRSPARAITKIVAWLIIIGCLWFWFQWVQWGFNGMKQTAVLIGKVGETSIDESYVIWWRCHYVWWLACAVILFLCRLVFFYKVKKNNGPSKAV